MKVTQAGKIEDYCLEFYKKLDFTHNPDHLYKTVGIAEYIAEQENANLQ